MGKLPKSVQLAAKAGLRNQLPKIVGGFTFRNGVEVTDTPAQNAA